MYFCSKNTSNIIGRKEEIRKLQKCYNLYRTLFRNSDLYVRVVEALSNKKSGMTRGEISAATKMPNNGDLTRVLQNLVDSDFVRQYHFFGNKRKNMVYQLCDNYTLFYYRFIKDNYGRDERYWTNLR